MNTVKRYLRLYRVLVTQFLKTIMQSRVDFLIGLFGFFLTQVMGIAFLYLVFQQIPDLQGWTLDQLIFIYGFAQIPRGIDHLFTDNIWLVAYRLVINGDFDRYMLRPMNIFFQVIAEKLQPADWHHPCRALSRKGDCDCGWTAHCAVFCIHFCGGGDLYID